MVWVIPLSLSGASLWESLSGRWFFSLVLRCRPMEEGTAHFRIDAASLFSRVAICGEIQANIVPASKNLSSRDFSRLGRGLFLGCGAPQWGGAVILCRILCGVLYEYTRGSAREPAHRPAQSVTGVFFGIVRLRNSSFLAGSSGFWRARAGFGLLEAPASRRIRRVRQSQ